MKSATNPIARGWRSVLLLATAQSADALTTVAGRIRGAVELSPLSRSLIEEGGIALFWSFKLLLVLIFATALLIAFRWMRATPGRGAAVVATTVAVVRGCSVVTVAAALMNTLVVATS